MWTLPAAVAAIALTLRSPGDGFEGMALARMSSTVFDVPAIAVSGRSVDKAYWNLRCNCRRQWSRVGPRRWNGGPPVWVGGCWRWRATHWGIGQIWSCW